MCLLCNFQYFLKYDDAQRSSGLCSIVETNSISFPLSENRAKQQHVQVSQVRTPESIAGHFHFPVYSGCANSSARGMITCERESKRKRTGNSDKLAMNSIPPFPILPRTPELSPEIPLSLNPARIAFGSLPKT